MKEINNSVTGSMNHEKCGKYEKNCVPEMLHEQADILGKYAENLRKKNLFC